MSTQPATYNLRIPQRASLSEVIRVPYDGTGAEVFASIWDSPKRRRKFLDLSVTWIDRYDTWVPSDPSKVRSVFRVHATWEETKTVTKDGYWDLLWVWPDGLRDYLLEGDATINLNVTEEAA